MKRTTDLLPSLLPVLLAAAFLTPRADAVSIVNPVTPTLLSFGATEGDELAPTFGAAGLSASPLNSNGSRATLEAGERLPGSVFLDIEILSPNGATAVANDQYFQFSLSPLGEQTLQVVSMSFSVARGGASAPRGWVVRTSLDGFGSDLATGLVPTVQPQLSPVSIPFTDPAFQNLGEDLTVRLYGYAPGANGVGIYFDDITLLGNVVPEPAAALLVLAGLLAAMRRKRA